MAKIMAYSVGCNRILADRFIQESPAIKACLWLTIIDTDERVMTVQVPREAIRKAVNMVMLVEKWLLGDVVSAHISKVEGEAITWLIEGSRHGVKIERWHTWQKTDPKLMQTWQIPASALDQFRLFGDAVMEQFELMKSQSVTVVSDDTDDIPF